MNKFVLKDVDESLVLRTGEEGCSIFKPNDDAFVSIWPNAEAYDESKSPKFSVARRFNEGKPQLSLVLEAREALADCSRVLQYGKDKYDKAGERNWKKGLPLTQTCDSLLRHISSLLAGEDKDPETGLNHTAHILSNALFLAENFITHPDMDDRPK